MALFRRTPFTPVSLRSRYLPGLEQAGVSGDIAVTEADDTASAAGLIVVQGTIAVTEADDTSSVAGVVSSQGSIAVTEAADTSSATGVIGLVGSAAVTEANDVAAASGIVTVSGTIAVTEANDTASVLGVIGLGGSASVTEANDTAAASGTVIWRAGFRSALPLFFGSGLASPGVSGSAAITEANDVASIVGVLPGVTAERLAGFEAAEAKYRWREENARAWRRAREPQKRKLQKLVQQAARKIEHAPNPIASFDYRLAAQQALQQQFISMFMQLPGVQGQEAEARLMWRAMVMAELQLRLAEDDEEVFLLML